MSERGPLYVLGINAYDHDVSACLLEDGEIVVAVAKERLTRVKQDTGFHDVAVDYCLEAAGIPYERVDLVVRNSYMLPAPEFEHRLLREYQPQYLSNAERERAKSSPHFLPDPTKVITCSHHLAHAYSAFAVSPFDEGAVMVVDGVGSYRPDVLEDFPDGNGISPLARESESYYHFTGTRLETIEKVWMEPTRGLVNDEFYMMQGLGALYSRVATHVFGDWFHCGEVMGLAPFGRPVLEPLIRLVDGRLVLRDWGIQHRHPFLGGTDDDWSRHPYRRDWEDLAYRIQADTEQILVERARKLHERTGSKNLCLAGGVALNCVANARILEETPFEHLFIQPAAGDDGVALGCAYYGHLAVREQPRLFVMQSAHLGRDYRDEEIRDTLRSAVARFTTSSRRADDVASTTAGLLSAGSVVGWFQGRSEFGPRALGNRSILADPRDPTMKDRVNARVKGRQSFRPFAPVVMAERAHEYFEGEAESPFMLLVKRLRPEALERVPAIAHVDGTARVQTLRREQNPRLYALIEAFDQLTGVPVLLNTSFNLRGEPIVETPQDAMACFLASGLDVLVLHDWVVKKRLAHRAVFSRLQQEARLRLGTRADGDDVT